MIFLWRPPWVVQPDEKESERMCRGTVRIARSAKKGNRCRGWRPTATGRGATRNFETRNSELDNTSGTINVTFRNDVRRQVRGDIPLFPTGSYNCLPSFSRYPDASGNATLYLIPLFLVFSTEGERWAQIPLLARGRGTSLQSMIFSSVCNLVQFRCLSFRSMREI